MLTLLAVALWIGFNGLIALGLIVASAVSEARRRAQEERERKQAELKAWLFRRFGTDDPGWTLTQSDWALMPGTRVSQEAWRYLTWTKCEGTLLERVEVN